MKSRPMLDFQAFMINLPKKMNESEKWAAYGKWRASVYPSADFDFLNTFYQTYYHLLDLKVVLTYSRPYHGVYKIEFKYPK